MRGKRNTDRIQSFSTSYPEARAKFRAAADAVEADVECLASPMFGPDGEALSTDVAWIGPREAERVLTLISGVHGVEGYCGSGAQVDWMRSGEAARMPKGTAALLIHAANPHGFAWTRRVTEENVDLNRNWVDFRTRLPENPDYEMLREALVPRTWTPKSRAASAEVFGAYIGTHGFPRFQAVVSGGQYTDPRGLFYGGQEPTRARRTLSGIVTGRLSAARRVAVIDYHTGLGAWGVAEEIVSERRDTAVFTRAARWFGAGVTSSADGSSVSADLSGDGLIGICRLLPHAEVTAIALEFGVSAIEDTFDALRADAWLHLYGEPISTQGQRIRTKMLAAFYDQSAVWKGMVLGQSRSVIRRALAGLNQSD
ncbi:M14 family metallopeptidase [Azospirillum melinis]